MAQVTVKEKRAKEIIDVLQKGMESSGGQARLKETHTDPDNGEVYQIDFDVSVGDNLAFFEALRGASLGWSDAIYEHVAAHWVMRASKRDGLSGL